MKYRDLYESMQEFTEEEFNQDVTLLIEDFDEYYPISKPMSHVGVDETDVLDPGHRILVL